MVLTEISIKYALKNCKSAQHCAEFLNVSFNTFKKYATSYVDGPTGKTLFDLAKKLGEVNGRRSINRQNIGVEGTIERILRGETKNNYSHQRFLEILLHYAKFESKCMNCGYSERRIIDYRVPLQLDFIDGHQTNGHIENLRVLCLNCYFQLVGNVYIIRRDLNVDGIDSSNFSFNEMEDEIDLSNIDTTDLDLSDLGQ